MDDGRAQQSLPRPRWGTYSVRAHTDLSRLIADALLYDVLVFPCPEDDGDFERWEQEGWNPELLALRVTQLGDAAAVIPWDRHLRGLWADKYARLTPEQRQDPGIAYDLTSWQLSSTSYVALMGEDDDRLPDALRQPPQVHPRFAAQDGRPRAQHEELELVAAFQQSWEAACFAGVSGAGEEWQQPAYIPDPAVRLRLRLVVPEDAGQDMFFRTLDLIADADFRLARGRLWAWEQALAGDIDPREAQLRLETLVEDYNTAIRRQIRQTRLKTVFLFVPLGVGTAVDLLITGGLMHAVAAAGTGALVERTRAHFPLLNGRAVRASHLPGSAIDGMLSVVTEQ